MKASVLAFAALFTAFAVPAFADDCDDAQSTAVGQSLAKVTKDAVGKIVPVTGKQMVNIEECQAAGPNYTVSYKYNFLSADGLYWIDVSAVLKADGSVKSFKLVNASPNFKAAQAKSGAVLAAN